MHGNFWLIEHQDIFLPTLQQYGKQNNQKLLFSRRQILGEDGDIIFIKNKFCGIIVKSLPSLSKAFVNQTYKQVFALVDLVEF